MHRRSLVVLAGLLVLAPAALAAPPEVPAQISYQGVLLDTAGEPRTGNVDLVLRIWDAPTGGTLVYKQEFPAVALSAGVFTVRLGPTGSASDSPDDPLTTSLAGALGGDAGPTAPARFLEVTVGIEGALARTQILTAPYALRAASADSAAVAANVTAVNGLDSAVLNQLFEFSNSDGQGPANNDPAEGTGDTDGDGTMNFVDPDNDDDSILDGAEQQNGSNLNVTTPTLNPLPSMLAAIPLPFTATGLHFDPAMTVFLDGDPIPASNVTATSARFDIPGVPHPVGQFPVHVQLPNGERSLDQMLNFLGTPAPGLNLSFGLGETVSLSVRDGAKPVVANGEAYAVDSQEDGSTDQLVPFDQLPAPPTGTPPQIAVAWGADGRLLGLRCVPNGTGCQIQVVRDADENLVLDAGPGDQVLLGPSYVGTQLRLWGPSVASDASGNLVAGYVLVDDTGAAQPTVLHDRNGDDAFSAGAPETVVIENLVFSPGNLGKLAIDPAGRVAYAYVKIVFSGPSLIVAYDRNDDGDFADTVAGTPETFTAIPISAASTGRPCGGIAFDGNGHLAALLAEPTASSVRILRDVNGDGDFGDGVDTQLFAGPGTSQCDIAGHPTGGLAVAHSGQVWIDRNSDTDFDDANEVQTLGGARAVTFSGQGRVWASGTSLVLFIDPF